MLTYKTKLKTLQNNEKRTQAHDFIMFIFYLVTDGEHNPFRAGFFKM